MKRIFISVLVTFFLLAAYGYYVYQSSYGAWEIKQSNSTKISWANFSWVNDTLSGKYYEKTAMLIPCRIEGINNYLSFQFDIGANLSMLYENNLSSFYFQNEAISDHVKSFNFPANLISSRKFFKNLNISFGDYTISNKSSVVLEGYGHISSAEKLNRGDTIHIGTIGADLFQGKVLIIDYPNQRFAICEETPAQFENTVFDIDLDSYGRPILLLTLNSKEYRLLFDNGSSLFPIITSSENIDIFSTNPVIDSLEISSWGEKHMVGCRMITDTFEIGNWKYSDVKVYENHSGLGIDKKTDGMLGNFLFWDNTIVIDFKNCTFGVQ